MGERIGVSKVARMLGIGRADLNKRLLAAGIPTFEGQVDFEKVKCIAPTLNMDDSELLQRIQYVRENLSKPVTAPAPGQPSENLAEDLAGEVRKLSTALVIEQRMGRHYRQILIDLADKLGELQMSGEPQQRDMAFELCEWLRKEITSD